MTSINEIKIIGIDETRPPRVRKESYIDLYFKLSHKVPADWCEDFNALARSISPIPKIDKNTRESIETYVNDMDLIAGHLNEIKKVILECHAQYMEKLNQKELALAASNATMMGEGGEQQRLNKIIAALDFAG